MLIPETPYPQVGSYALLIDYDAPPPQASELVRILRLPPRPGDPVLVSFPLREGASGTKLVEADALIDASPLTREEQREFHDLDRLLHGREPSALSKALRTKKKRRDELRLRMINGPILDRQLRFARAQQQRRAA